jgi:hypothetical protein
MLVILIKMLHKLDIVEKLQLQGNLVTYVTYVFI